MLEQPGMNIQALGMVVLLAFAPLGCRSGASGGGTASEVTVSRVSGGEARALVASGALLLDVRTPAEFAKDGVPAAKNVPYDEIEARAGELQPKDRPVVVYCRSGNRSAIAARSLQRLGFTRVHDLGARSAW